MEVVMKEYTATTLERARHVLKKFPLSDGAKMAIGKDLEYGYTWAATPENKRALVATVPPRKPGVFTVFTHDGHTLNLTGNALTQMIENARTRHRNTTARIDAFATRRNNIAQNDPGKIAHDTASTQREQRDYEAGLRNTFRVAGWGDMEFTSINESDHRPDRGRSGVVEETNDLRTMARGKQTRSGKTIPDQRASTNGTIEPSLSAIERRGVELQPQNKNVVWVADGRDGHHRKRIVVRAGATDLTGEL
jgi:hypothetical protein